MVDVGDVQEVPGLGDIHKVTDEASKGPDICCWKVELPRSCNVLYARGSTYTCPAVSPLFFQIGDNLSRGIRTKIL